MFVGEVVFALLAVVGLCDVFRAAVSWLYSAKGNGTLTLTFHLTGHLEDVEYLVRSALQKLRAARGVADKRLLLVDDGMDEETRRICRLLLYDQPQATLCSPEEAAEWFANEG